MKQAVQLKQLPDMNVAEASVNSASPEHDAFEILLSWAESQGLLSDARPYRLFGFDNCRPEPDHVYTVWMTLEPDAEAVIPGDEIRLKKVKGGMYATSKVTGVQNIKEGWDNLAAWGKSHGHKISRRPSLEEHFSPIDTPPEAFELELYLALTG